MPAISCSLSSLSSDLSDEASAESEASAKEDAPCLLTSDLSLPPPPSP